MYNFNLFIDIKFCKIESNIKKKLKLFGLIILYNLIEIFSQYKRAN